MGKVKILKLVLLQSNERQINAFRVLQKAMNAFEDLNDFWL